MKPIRFYLDEAADRGIVKNDAELARMVGVDAGLAMRRNQ